VPGDGAAPMRQRHGEILPSRVRVLLAVDALLTALLGAFLLFFPGALVDALGVPAPDPSIYANLAGAVLLGFAFLLSRTIQRPEAGRTVMEAATVTNLLAAVVLVIWLTALDNGASATGKAVLGVVAGGLAAVGALQARELRGASV
jgi:drug/metabolite transporter (DMT)-like permease